VAFRLENVDIQLHVANGLVDLDLGPLHLRRVPALATAPLLCLLAKPIRRAQHHKQKSRRQSDWSHSLVLSDRDLSDAETPNNQQDLGYSCSKQAQSFVCPGMLRFGLSQDDENASLLKSKVGGRNG
jgi:hypothetical protein